MPFAGLGFSIFSCLTCYSTSVCLLGKLALLRSSWTIFLPIKQFGPAASGGTTKGTGVVHHLVICCCPPMPCSLLLSCLLLAVYFPSPLSNKVTLRSVVTVHITTQSQDHGLKPRVWTRDPSPGDTGKRGPLHGRPGAFPGWLPAASPTPGAQARRTPTPRP